MEEAGSAADQDKFDDIFVNSQDNIGKTTTTTVGANELFLHCAVCQSEMSERRKISSDVGGETSSMAQPFVICQACKKFFQRNRNRHVQSLRCVTGNNNCSIGSTTASYISSGVLWRKICPRCRLSKCLAVGMRNLKI